MIADYMDFPLSFTDHARQRLSERHTGFSEYELLCTELVPADQSIKSVYYALCSRSNRGFLESGLREIKSFKGTDILAVLDCSKMLIVTILPSKNISIKEKSLSEREVVSNLKKKLKQIDLIPLDIKHILSMGMEIKSICNELSRLNKKLKVENIKRTEDETSFKMYKLQHIVEKELGRDRLNRFFEEVNKEFPRT